MPAPHPYIIRRAALTDLAEILTLVHELGQQHVNYDPARYAMPPTLPDAYREWLSRSHETPTDGPVLCLLARSPDTVPSAYLLAEAFPADPKCFTDRHIYIHDIYLSPQSRGTGLSQAFIEELRRWAQSRDIRSFRALVSTKNNRSLAFFSKLGFRATATEVSAEWP